MLIYEIMFSSLGFVKLRPTYEIVTPGRADSMQIASVFVAVMGHLYCRDSSWFLFYRSYAGGSMFWIALSLSMSRPIIFFAQSRQ